MQCKDNKRPMKEFYGQAVDYKDESTFSGLRGDIIHSDGSKKKEAWSFPYLKCDSLASSR